MTLGEINQTKALYLYLFSEGENKTRLFSLWQTHISRASFYLPETVAWWLSGTFCFSLTVADPLIENIECWEDVIPCLWFLIPDGSGDRRSPSHPQPQRLIPESLWKHSGLHYRDEGLKMSGMFGCCISSHRRKVCNLCDCMKSRFVSENFGLWFALSSASF